ncbi:CHASE domain-containing protein [Geothrix sp. PMB-07]|uniref:CHASE domain-containing protein n=1 Tax=Geothrix sp. PMB-07 TaxID=3068640 RepID=UPI0027421DB9|nr:CHASE domain-containing protein [Geothrix sp. PMB-07]WLT32077.1 CHASE domain-containing protein [Geothrix sp. PMB-07]
MSPFSDAPPIEPAPSRRPWVLALVVLGLSLGITGLAWHTARQSQYQRDLNRLNRFVSRTEQSLQNRLGRYEDIARGAKGFFAEESRPLSLEKWRAYVDGLDLTTRHPGLTSLAIITPVEPADLAAFMNARPQLRGRYHRPIADPAPLRDPGQDGNHLIIELCEPGGRATLALGLDVGTSHTQRVAAERARDTGLPALSGLVYFTRPTGREDAVVLLVPEYSRPVDSLEARRQAFKGWISAGILLKPLIEDILRGEDTGVAFEVVDAFASQGPQWLYASPDWPKGATPDTLRMLDVGGRGWQLRYAIRPAFYKAEGRNQPLIILVGGVIVSLCLSAVVWSLAGTRRRALDLARSMNASLHGALQRNRSHLAYTPLAVLEMDAHFRITEWNDAAERMFGYSREDMLGQDPRLLVPEDGQAEVLPRREALLKSESGTRATMENVTRTGQRIQCDWYNAAVRNEHGEFIGAIFLADDITDRRRVEGALRQAQKLESLGVLAGGIAHDFNNLLTAILGNTEVALERIPDDPALRSAIQRIEAATQRGSDLARQLLAYAGKAHFAVRPLDLNATLIEMGDLLSVSISKMVGIRMDLQPDLPPVDADSAQFQQVVMNLVINASEAIGDHTGVITLRTRAVEYRREDLSAAFPGQVLEPGLFVRMEVEDDGCGMDAETIGRIFDPFFTTKFTGRGLGLSAMLGIVRGHRAGIRVESTPGKGTTFILLFPASEASVAQLAPEAQPLQPMTGTILVVDDEGIIRDLARTALENAGFRVLEARDGLEAVERFEENKERIHLVLLDMTMPRMGGAEAFRRIRALAPQVKVLLTSGYTQKESLESLSDLPPDGFLQKPFRVRELITRVRDILRDSNDKFTTK